jgi:hypothetical protein
MPHPPPAAMAIASRPAMMPSGRRDEAFVTVSFRGGADEVVHGR